MLAFIAIVAMIFPLLRVTRDQMGWRIFDGLVWSYFIAHFIKAELFIAKTVHGPDLRLMSKDVRNVFLIPLVSFVYLSLALLAREFWVDQQLELFFLGVLVTIVCFAMGAARDLFDPTRWPYMLTAAFLISEGFGGDASALSWTTCSQTASMAFTSPLPVSFIMPARMRSRCDCPIAAGC